MVVPFWDNGDGLGLRHVLQSVAKYLNSQLFHILSKCKGFGRLQEPLVCIPVRVGHRRALYGQPVCTESRRYSPSLGISSNNPNNMTLMRVREAPPVKASVREAPPPPSPLDIWF